MVLETSSHTSNTIEENAQIYESLWAKLDPFLEGPSEMAKLLLKSNFRDLSIEWVEISSESYPLPPSWGLKCWKVVRWRQKYSVDYLTINKRWKLSVASEIRQAKFTHEHKYGYQYEHEHGNGHETDVDMKKDMNMSRDTDTDMYTDTDMDTEMDTDLNVAMLISMDYFQDMDTGTDTT
jgi:hypothetical protein